MMVLAAENTAFTSALAIDVACVHVTPPSPLTVTDPLPPFAAPTATAVNALVNMASTSPPPTLLGTALQVCALPGVAVNNMAAARRAPSRPSP
jgi:hypothetical protein